MVVLIKTAAFDDSHSVYLLPLEELSKKNEILENVEAFHNLENSHEDQAAQEKLEKIEVDIEVEDNATLEQERIDDLISNAKEEAYREGYSEGFLEIKSKYQEKLEMIDALLNNINEASSNYIKSTESIIASIVFESICKIIGEELADKSKSIEVVNYVIKAINQEEIREVLISQEDFDSIESFNSEMNLKDDVVNSKGNNFKFKVDQNIKIGGCKIKLGEGFLDASIDMQLKLLSNSIKAKVSDLDR